MRRLKLLLCFIFALSTFTEVWCQNKSMDKISKIQAIADLEQFEHILRVESSYFGLKPFDLDLRLEKLKSKFEDSVEVTRLGIELEKIMGEVGDRHSSITNFEKIEDIFLPFVLAPLDKRLVALKEIEEGHYSVFIEKYPYLKKIDGIAVEDFMKEISWKNKYAPYDAKLTYAARDLLSIGWLYYKLDKPIPNSIKFTFADGENDFDKKIKLRKKRQKPWSDVKDRRSLISAIDEDKVENDTLFEIINGDIGYFRIPRMWNFNQNPDLFPLIKTKMNEFRNTRALILDVRNNGGGERDILMTLAPYLIKPGSVPWVANLAKIRIDQTLDEDISSMKFRYLYNIDSPELDDSERKSITDFMKDYSVNWNYDPNKYSDFFYMVMDTIEDDSVFYYDKPVYVLANERSFSATSVFVTALKGMNKIKIVGVNTDGSSGRSRRVPLNNSGIIVRYSTMISFQRNGETLDTNGTKPDIYIPRDLDQVLGFKDSQLNRVINLIEKN